MGNDFDDSLPQWCCACHSDPTTADGKCPDDPSHICSQWPLCPCDFTEEDAVGVLTGLGFEVAEKGEK